MVEATLVLGLVFDSHLSTAEKGEQNSPVLCALAFLSLTLSYSPAPDVVRFYFLLFFLFISFILSNLTFVL